MNDWLPIRQHSIELQDKDFPASTGRQQLPQLADIACFFGQQPITNMTIFGKVVVAFGEMTQCVLESRSSR